MQWSWDGADRGAEVTSDTRRMEPWFVVAFCLFVWAWFDLRFSPGRWALRMSRSSVSSLGSTMLVDRSPNVVPVVPHTEITSVLAAILAGVTTFAATNVDDLLLLSVFFARREPMRRVVAGQYLGFAGSVPLSMLGFWSALAIPLSWLRFLWFLPLAIGIKRLLHIRKAEVPAANNFKVLSIARSPWRMAGTT